MEFTFQSASPELTEMAGEQLGQRVKLRPEWGKVILLSGELGSGKTTFIRGFFRGLDFTETPTSPTFTFFREYRNEAIELLHADLYRFREENPTQSAEILTEQLTEAAESGKILLVEWADIFPLEDQFSENLIQIRIEPGNTSEKRKNSVFFRNAGSISTAQTMALMDEFFTPFHVRKHIFAVTAVAEKIAVKLFQNGVLLDPELVKNGALCHDLVRYVDFRDFDDHSRFEEEVTAEKLQFWKNLKEKYQTMHHAEAISDILRQRGFYATAKVTEAHHTTQIFREEPFSWEEKVVYYADKRALHDRIVSLEERFTDGRKRYALEANPELEKKVFDLEREIFSYLTIAPEDIGN